MNHEKDNARTAYLMLCACTAILFLSLIVISVVSALSEKVMPAGAGEEVLTFQYIFKTIILVAFLLSALALWIFNWLLIAKTWPRRSVLLNCLLIFVQMFGTFINYLVFFIMFYKRENFPLRKNTDRPA